MDTAAENNGHLTGLSPSRLSRIGDHLNRNYIDNGKIAGCQVLVARHGAVAYRQCFGQMDLERARPMAPDAIYRIYSMTKPITSAALMTLYEKGLFQLDDPVSRFIPEWRDQRVWRAGSGEAMETEKPKRPPTMRDMLCHTGGLTYGRALVALGAPDDGHPVDLEYERHGVQRQGVDLREFVRRMGRVPLRYQPGQRWMYSLSTDVCGALVEILSGKPLDEYFQETIFDPLGMKDTAFFVVPEKSDRLAANYQRRADKTLKLIDDPQNSSFARKPQFLSGGGGLTGTIDDYWRFCEMLRRGGALDGARILGPRTVALMHRNHLPGGKELTEMAIDSFSETSTDGVGFGLGFAMVLDSVRAGGLGQGDYYWGGAASTIFWVDPVEDITVVFMTQLMPSGAFNFRGQLRNIIYSAIED